MIGCSNSENKKIQDNQIPVPTSINSFFETAPSLISLDSTYYRTIEKWNEIIIFSDKFSDLIEKEINVLKLSANTPFSCLYFICIVSKVF